MLIPFQEISEWLTTEVTTQISWCLNQIFGFVVAGFRQVTLFHKLPANSGQEPRKHRRLSGLGSNAPMASASASGLFSHQWWLPGFFRISKNHFRKGVITKLLAPNCSTWICIFVEKNKWLYLYKLLPGQQVAVKFHQLLPLKNTHGCQKIWYALACPPFQ